MAVATAPASGLIRLLADAQGGDQRAFSLLLRHLDERMRALAWKMLGDRDRMDDALQEAYAKAWRSLASFRGDADFGTWLYRITYNACLDELRRDARRPRGGRPVAPAPACPRAVPGRGGAAPTPPARIGAMVAGGGCRRAGCGPGGGDAERHQHHRPGYRPDRHQRDHRASAHHGAAADRVGALDDRDEHGAGGPG